MSSYLNDGQMDPRNGERFKTLDDQENARSKLKIRTITPHNDNFRENLTSTPNFKDPSADHFNERVMLRQSQESTASNVSTTQKKNYLHIKKASH